MLSITDDDLNDLTRAARAAGRRRMNRNLHPALTDQVQRLLNAFEPGTYVRPHRHDAGRWELFLILRGRAALLAFDDHGRVAARHELAAAGPMRLIEVPGGTWHTLAALEPGTLLFEVKPGPYVPLTDKDFAAWAPGEGEQRAAAYEQWFRRAQPGETHAGQTP